jgi:ribosomal 50S subunit-recycling heat shock protein
VTKFIDKQFKVENLKTRLDKYLAEQLPQISRSQIQREIELGLVLVNGKKVQESKHVVRLGDTVVYNQSINHKINKTEQIITPVINLNFILKSPKNNTSKNMPVSADLDWLKLMTISASNTLIIFNCSFFRLKTNGRSTTITAPKAFGSPKDPINLPALLLPNTKAPAQTARNEAM